MAQINLTVGAIEGNTEAVLAAARESVETHGARLVVFPELTLIGYPPEDLLLRPSLELRIKKAIQRLLDSRLDAYLVVGFPLSENGAIFNALLVIANGKIVCSYKKQCLPNYQVFDERRYFQPGDGCSVIELDDVKVAFTICEDLWESQPMLQARSAGAELMVNISASPFHMRKLDERRQLLRERAMAGGMPVIYCNLVGGQDELVFDGASMVVDAQGECRFLAPSFAEGLFPVQLQVTTELKGKVAVPQHQLSAPLSLEAEVYQALVLGVRDYVNKNRFGGAVLGLSGGIDSALTLAIAVDAIGRERVRAVMMPSAFTSALSLRVARQQAESFGVEYTVLPIDAPYGAFLEVLADEFAGQPQGTAEQNIQARCRGVLLMAISNKKGYLVLTTGNKSEIAVGYSTLYGDMAGGFDVLKDVYKTLVYRLAGYRNTLVGELAGSIPQDVIDRAPSAELAPGQKDEDSLPPYPVLDRILEHYIESDWSAKAIIDAGFEPATVHRVLRMVDVNEFKRRQSPVGVRLTKRGFGRDRRYPITNAWELGE